MSNRKIATWMWAAWASATGGCAALVGLEDGYHLEDGSGGAAGGGRDGGADGGGETCTPSGVECDGQTCVDGQCTGVCRQRDTRCQGNAWQLCDGHGQWTVALPCHEMTPVCTAQGCTSPPSCRGRGAPTCAQGESCCASREIAGGTFHRDNDGDHPATVGDFLLDRFEVSVGRFRKFVEVYPRSKPAPGAGRHPSIEGSGWDAGWDANLPADSDALKAAVKCSPGHPTWTDEPGDHELLPMNCLSWYVAFAFCAWDGGRLPTEAEWNYAAAGGDEQRAYPWSTIAEDIDDPAPAVYGCSGDGDEASCAADDIRGVGSRSPDGDGRWRQADLGGNVWEWTLDAFGPYAEPCHDCASLDAGTTRVVRGGSWRSELADHLLTSFRSDADPALPSDEVGVRCAR